MKIKRLNEMDEWGNDRSGVPASYVNEGGLSELIEALQIFIKYGDPHYPTHCERNELIVMIDPELVTYEDMLKLEELGFESNEYGFSSTKFGAA
jgi:hypothetical protein